MFTQAIISQAQVDGLLLWYQEVRRPLPWRESRDPYRVLVSELMLQQTTVAAVVPLYRRWMERFPTLASLAEASPDQAMEAWSGLGYYNRARRLHQAAQMLVSRDAYPATLQEWLELPGLGPYTAAAVASIAFALPHLALDTNVLRVLLRYFGWEARPDNAAVQQNLRLRVEGAGLEVDFGILNQALMELGASLCSIRAPACMACPLSATCQAHALAIVDRIPLPKPKKPNKQTSVNAYMIVDPDRGVLLVRGTSLGLLGDLFQPPLDFLDENSASSPLTPWLERLREVALTVPTTATVSYGISGRKLTLSLKALPASVLQVGRHAEHVELKFWTPEATLGLSSLTRKLLKASEESLRVARPRADSCLESSPGPSEDPCL